MAFPSNFLALFDSYCAFIPDPTGNILHREVTPADHKNACRKRHFSADDLDEISEAYVE
jgi:hypothetical protein